MSDARTQLRWGATHVFSGYAKNDSTGNGFEPLPGTLEPIRDLLLASASKAVKDKTKPGKLVLWKTDAKGLLHRLGDTFADDQKDDDNSVVHYGEDGASVTVVPGAVVLNAWAAHQDKWPGALKAMLEKSFRGEEGVHCREIPVTKNHLRPPDRSSQEEDEKAYAAFFDGFKDSAPPLAGIVIPRVRAAVLVFSDPRFARAVVHLTPEKGKTLTGDVKRVAVPSAVQGSPGGLVCAVVIGTREMLPAGLYEIKIDLPQGLPPDGFNPQFAKSYVLHEYLAFDISSYAGEFDVVCADPISVEEAVLQQFATLYGHLLAHAVKREFFSEVENKQREFPVALKPWSERIGWMQSKSKMIASAVNGWEPDKKRSAWDRTKTLGSAVQKALEPLKDPLAEATKDGLKLFFDLADSFENAKELREELKLERSALKGIKEILWSEVEGLDKYRWWTYVKKAWKDEERGVVFRLAKAGERPGVLKMGIPRKRTNLQEIVGNKTGAGIEKGLAIAGTAVQVLDTALAFNEVVVAAEKKDQLRNDFKKLIGKVESELHRRASREGIGTLERMRSAMVGAELALGDAEAKALMSAFDTVLGVLTALGVGGPALGVVVWAKEAGGLVLDATEFLDRWAFHGFIEDLFAHQKAMFKLAQASRINQDLISEGTKAGAEGKLQVQFLLRAEALLGLVRLFTRASIAVKYDAKNPDASAAEYLAQVKKYRIQEYVERTLLGGAQWQLPLRPFVPIGLDTLWLYMTGQRSGLSNAQELANTLGYVKPLPVAVAAGLPFGMLMLGVANEQLQGNVSAQFQETFPIHRMEASVFDELAMAFRTTWPEVEKDAVEYTCIYVRPPGSTADTAWRPLNERHAKRVDDLPLLSPFDQLRILVVFKDKVKGGPYPLSFQLVRTDGRNVAGPIYRQITKCLGDSDLLPAEVKKFKGRVGCVFHPFYRLGPQTVPGVKILAPGASWGGIYDLLGYLDDMRYGFELKVGASGSADFITIGGPDCAVSPLDEFRLGITHKPNEDKLLDSSFLTREGEAFEYPKLPGAGAEVVACYGRIGSEPWRLATYEENGNRIFQNYNWWGPVEFVVVVAMSFVRAQVYEEQSLEWWRIPVTMDLVEFTGMDHLGPSYESNLEYVGHTSENLGKSPARFMDITERWSPGEIPEPGAEVSEWARQVKSNPLELAKLRAAALGADNGYPQHIFAAHFGIDYYTPSGEQKFGLRPFGSVVTNASGHLDHLYRIGVRNVRTPPDVHIKGSKIEVYDRGVFTTSKEYEFHFPAPVEGSAYPWGTMRRDDAGQKKWIGEDAQSRDPRVRLLHGMQGA